ncbi:MAG: purine-nucleoside phosphorylase [Myxococcota bacterium]|jgi:purine-nucleoside phosphorylase|nr:purine-nucleoside phosphorylase [Myxococcota bacterium]
MRAEWTYIKELADELKERGVKEPEVFLVLGSGLGEIVEALEDRLTIDTHDLHGWPFSTVPGHAGALHWGRLGQCRVLMQQGRVHLYEGYEPPLVVRPVRTAIELGAKIVILTNAAGGVRQDLRPGTLLLLRDHLNLTGRNPLVGPNNDSRGPRFPDMSEIYDKALRRLLLDAAAALDLPLAEGVYAGLLGPSYETPAEVRMLGMLGADAVGMSTVLEAIAARHLGAAVAAVSCITNMAAGLPGAVLDHGEVQRMGATAGKNLAELLKWSLSRTHSDKERS